ncbi:MAG: GCN5-related N-acetyltransferase [Frankiales bacterium]|nr:GCN5-related N-acetyltransferase [Frankiales bacterium]
MQTSWYDGSWRDGVVELVQSVAALGGAVGWLTVPPPEDVDSWLASIASIGDARMAIATEGDRVLASGIWRRHEAEVLKRTGRVWKVMTPPDARRRGAGRAVMELLIADARAEGIELLTLECRGNNHGAQRMYADLGFRVTGRLPDALAIGEERFDQVLMHLDLRGGRGGLVRHGSRREGLGTT